MRTSANTSINQRVPALFKKVQWKEGTVNLDYGCGKYPEYARDYVTARGVLNVSYDPYNYRKTEDIYSRFKYDTITLSNVLNVIESEDTRCLVLLECFWLLKKGGKLYITVYEGDKSRVGRETKPDCWQENRPLRSYAKEVVRAYDGAKIKIKNGVMEVTK